MTSKDVRDLVGRHTVHVVILHAHDRFLPCDHMKFARTVHSWMRSKKIYQCQRKIYRLLGTELRSETCKVQSTGRVGGPF